MKRVLLLLSLLVTIQLHAATAKVRYPGTKTYAYRYTLKDKSGTAYSLEKPLHFLSRKSLERRQRQGLSLDSTDLPVSRTYIRQFRHEGAHIIGTSRWQNTILVSSPDTLLLQRLARLSCIKESRLVFISPDSIEAPQDIRWNLHESFNRWDSVKNDPYGMMRPQIEMLNGIRLHDAGYKGRGLTIAICDGGFQNYHRIPALKKARILGTHDFLMPRQDLENSNPFSSHAIDHGTKVFSAMAAQAPDVGIGTAPEASYWLFRCEDPNTEQPIEEDYWTMAVEMADSVGADIINSSLGYYAFDDGRGNYRLQDLNGHTAFISRTASMLARKGIVHCNSAGNSGMGQWKKIGVPADAPDILTVGAIDKTGHIAPFSSIGPSQDGRIKPDIVAQGAPTALISGRGTLVHDMGTSFSTPLVCGLVACLWQALPDKTALEIIELIKSSAHQHAEPTNIYGHGTPDFWKAYQMGIKQ